ncbi:hypothetical protein MPSEU_000231500 [Mayamaea pseudoterrestris]|nr:hypothetical protein MPSEU_000231500 [Mayamaea pseudoterrestris]
MDKSNPHMNIHQPLFAPASQAAGTQSEDFDLSDIFGEYFQNEFDDPMNAYTSSMANYTGGQIANPMAPTPIMQNATSTNTTAMSLPTGGIRTTFHYTSAPSVVQQQQQQQQEQPLPKKPRIDPGMNDNQMVAQQYQQTLQQQLAQQQAMQQQQQQQQQQPHPNTQYILQQQQLQQAAMAAHQQNMMQQSNMPTAPQHGGVQLPIGVGIRLGNLTGIAPAATMVQSSSQQQRMPGMPGVPINHQHPFNLWGGGMPMVGGALGTETNAAERRQRNREHAKRSRVRKKFMLEALQGEVTELQKINQWLRMLIQEHIPEHAMKIITECCSTSPLFADDCADGDDKRKNQPLLKSDFTLMHTLSLGQQCFVLSDPKLPDNPIVYASPGFYKLTGYTSKEVLGRNCRFLQGPGTDRQAVEILRQAVKTGSDATVCLLNYKSDGTPFWNQFFLASLRDSDNNIVNFVGVQTEVEPDAGVNALEEKVNEVHPLLNKDDDDDDDDGNDSS